MSIRFAAASDCAAMLAIYAPYIETTITFEQEVPSQQEFAARLETVQQEYPWIVWEEDGKILGYAYAHKFAERISYRPSAELSVYLDRAARGRGIGKKLYRALFAIGQLQNVKSVYGIVTSPNERSEAMHLAMGFTRVSTLKNVGYKDGWRDVSWFCKQIGAYAEPFTLFRPIGQLDPAQLEAVLRAELELNAARRVAVLEPVKLVIDNYPADQVEYFDLPNNPNRDANDTTTRPVAFTKEVWIDKSDFFEVPPPKFKRLTLGSEVRLMGAYLVRCTGVDKDEAGNVVTIHAEADLETRNGNPADGRKVRGTIHWVSCEHCVDAEIHLYDKLFTEANMNGIPDGADFKDYLNPDSVQVIDHAKLEESLADAKPGERFQFVRTGYFTPDSKNPHVYNRIVTLKDSFKF